MMAIQEMKKNIAHNRSLIGDILRWHGTLIEYLQEVEQRLNTLEGIDIQTPREKPVLIRIK